jgi:hypothetical protein
VPLRRKQVYHQQPFVAWFGIFLLDKEAQLGRDFLQKLQGRKFEIYLQPREESTLYLWDKPSMILIHRRHCSSLLDCFQLFLDRNKTKVRHWMLLYPRSDTRILQNLSNLIWINTRFDRWWIEAIRCR